MDGAQCPIYIRPMRHNSWFRILAGVLSAWLVICLAVPAQLHTCVMHGGLAIVANAGASHHAAAHQAHGASTAAANHSHHQNGDGQGNQCTCLGDCSTGRTVAVWLLLPSPLRRTSSKCRRQFLTTLHQPVVAPHFLRPFSNGPPDSSSRA